MGGGVVRTKFLQNPPSEIAHTNSPDEIVVQGIDVHPLRLKSPAQNSPYDNPHAKSWFPVPNPSYEIVVSSPPYETPSHKLTPKP